MDALHPGIPNTHPVGRRADYPLLFRLHLSGGGRHEELIYVRTVLVHTQRHWHPTGHFLVRHARSCSHMHHAHVYRQLRSVLLDDAAPQLAPFRHPTDLAPDGQHPVDSRTLSAQPNDRRRQHFSDPDCKKHYIFLYIWVLYTVDR